MKYCLSNIIYLFFLVISFGSCQKESTNPKSQEKVYTFENGLEGWTAGFADYPVGSEDFYELTSGHEHLPASVNSQSHGFMISGNNHSDDLFMFIKKRVEGLKPSTKYKLTFAVEFASKYPESSFGVGGSPGSSVYLKAGATSIEPKPVAQDNFYQLNIDKGQQAQRGEDMMVLGHIGIPGDEFSYKLISRDNATEPFEVITDENGNLWLIVGTDSGFEATTTLYYNTIKVSFKEVSGK